MSTGMSGTGYFPDVSRISRVTPERADRQRASLPAEPQEPDSPTERKRKWDESCRQETLRVAALAEENRKKREAEARQRAEAERHRGEAEQKQRELDQRRATYFKKIDEHNAMLSLAFAYAPTADEWQAVSEKMDALGLGLGSSKFSPEAWTMELLRLRNGG
jgi:hypothetical protein